MRKLCFSLLALAFVAGNAAYASCVFTFTGETTVSATGTPGPTNFVLKMELDDTNATVNNSQHAVIAGANSFVDFGGAIFAITSGNVVVSAGSITNVSGLVTSAGQLDININVSAPFGGGVASAQNLAEFKSQLNMFGPTGTASIGAAGAETYRALVEGGSGESFGSGVPEPSTLIGIFAFGIFGVGYRRRRTAAVG